MSYRALGRRRHSLLFSRARPVTIRYNMRERTPRTPLIHRILATLAAFASVFLAWELFRLTLRLGGG